MLVLGAMLPTTLYTPEKLREEIETRYWLQNPKEIPLAQRVKIKILELLWFDEVRLKAPSKKRIERALGELHTLNFIVCKSSPSNVYEIQNSIAQRDLGHEYIHAWTLTPEGLSEKERRGLKKSSANTEDFAFHPPDAA
mgnify:CR=1 FL=1